MVEEFGASVSGSINSSWDKESNILYAYIDSGSYRDDNAKDIEMSINMDSNGGIVGVFAKATLILGDIRITANIVPADVNAYRTKVVKQAFDVASALDRVQTLQTQNEIVTDVLGLLGFNNISG